MVRSFIESKTTEVQTLNVDFTSEVSDYLVVHTGSELPTPMPYIVPNPLGPLPSLELPTPMPYIVPNPLGPLPSPELPTPMPYIVPNPLGPLPSPELPTPMPYIVPNPLGPLPSLELPTPMPYHSAPQTVARRLSTTIYMQALVPFRSVYIRTFHST